MNPGRLVQRGSRGAAKFWIILVVAVVVVSILVAIKLGPVYSAKWDLEDRLEYEIFRYPELGEEGIFDELQQYVDNQKLPFNPWEDCKFEGEEGEPGSFTCNYKVKIDYFGVYTEVRPIHARGKLSKIPYD